MANGWNAFGARPKGERLERMRASPHYRNGRFFNDLEIEMNMVRATFKWLKGAKHREPKEKLHFSLQDLSQLPESGLRMTWLGHSSLLVEIDGLRVLVDPMLSDRSSPFSFMGPERFFQPFALDQLMDIDVVVLTHDHYDHLDRASIHSLKKETIVAPLGVGAHLEYWGVAPDRIVELDWWERHRIEGIELVATPARHFSGRAAFDRDLTLWASFALIGPEHSVFLSGDSGMFPELTEIGDRLGPFDATAIEIGAYDEAWADLHFGPEQAVAAHQAVNGRVMLPIHWGTFNLALHAWTEPIERLLVEAKEKRATFVAPKPGESIDPAQPPEVNKWWPDVPWKSAEETPIISSGLV